MRKSSSALLISAVSCMFLGQHVRAGIISPNTVVAGKTQSEWSAAWWRWALSYPASTNPLFDSTGAFAYLGNQGTVFFLAGTATGSPATRQATVGSGQYLFFPLLNTVTTADFSAYGGGEDNLKRDAAETLGIDPSGNAPNTTLFAELNGVNMPLPPPAATLLAFRQISPPGTFDVVIPADSPFGPPGVLPSKSDGWWLMLSPLAEGKYTLRFGGATTGIGAYEGVPTTQDNTFTITVVPEPATVVLVAAAGILVLLRRAACANT